VSGGVGVEDYPYSWNEPGYYPPAFTNSNADWVTCSFMEMLCYSLKCGTYAKHIGFSITNFYSFYHRHVMSMEALLIYPGVP